MARPERPMPSATSTVPSADGTPILTRTWPAPATGAWAHVLLVHGLGEHSGRYEHVGEQFAAAGLAVHGYDHRGNGGSGGRRGHVDRWSVLHDDLAERHTAVRREAAGRPVVLYGHSLGGLIVAGYLLSGYPRPDLAVLSAPGLDSTLPAWKKQLAVLLGRVLPTVSIPNDIDGGTLSRDPGVFAQMARDPLCCQVSTLGFGAAGLREQARVRAAAAAGLGVPTLVLHGEDDGLVPPGATVAFEGAPGMTRRTFPGLRHELHNEQEGPAVLDEVVAWLRLGVSGRS
jgi:alpha-beta hydrolase superfamily lysophospholipase